MIISRTLQEEFYNGVQAASILGVGKSQVSHLLAKGRFEGAFKVNGSWFIPKASVDNFQRKPRGFPKGTHKYGSKLKREVSQWLEAAGYSSEIEGK